MAFIEVANVTKEFKVFKREKGVKNALKSMVKREYEIKKAVDDISFSVERGELVGYIGPNGAGKSTTIKMLSGILVPTAGQIRVGGLIPYENRRENNLRMGVVFGQRSQLYWDLPMGETFELYQTMYRIEDAVYKRNVEFYIELLGMQDFLQTPVRQLSLGQKMRANLAIALLHDPPIVYLDEPTIGLDVIAKSRIRTFIKQVNREKNTTLVLTTHDMDDIETICNRLIMIDRGQKLYDGELAAFKSQYAGGHTLTVEVDEEQFSVPDKRMKLIKEEAHRKSLLFRKDEITPLEALEILNRQYTIRDFSLKEPDIEETVKEIYEKESEKRQAER